MDGVGVSQLTDKASLSALGGLVYRFGQPAKRLQDEDNDGVEDALDHCPGTEVDVWVDDEGCPFKPEPCEPEVVKPERDLGDDDKDGVVNADDQCPDTLENVPVNEAGCPRFVFSYNVDFEYNQYTIEHVATRPDINVLEFLKKNTNYKVQLVGYADNVGSDKFNEELALMRADEGLEFFLKGGIDRSRIEVIGRGEHESLRKNDSEESRSENRRVEVTFYREGALAK